MPWDGDFGHLEGDVAAAVAYPFKGYSTASSGGSEAKYATTTEYVFNGMLYSLPLTGNWLVALLPVPLRHAMFIPIISVPRMWLQMKTETWCRPWIITLTDRYAFQVAPVT
jgi:hypothetical protein